MQRWLLASTAALAAAAAPRRVAVTGAGGQTGQLAFRRMLARRDEFEPVWKSKFYGVFVLNHRVVLHASTRRLLDGVAMPVPRCSTEPGRPRHRREMT